MMTGTRVVIAAIFALAFTFAGAEPLTPERRAALKDFAASQEIEKLWADYLAEQARTGPAQIRQGAYDKLDTMHDIPQADRQRMRKVIDSLADAMADEMMREYRKLDIATIVDEAVLEVYGNRFSTAEIREATAFYRTNAGKKFLKLMPALKELLQRPGGREAVERAFTSQELQVIARFSQTSAGQKMQSPDLQKAMRSVVDDHFNPIVNRVAAKYRREIQERLRIY
jgi:hypothetical protein